MTSPRPSPGGASGSTGGVDQRSWGWHLGRASAWALLVLLPLWIVSVHVLGDASTVNATRLEVRWSSPAVRAFDWAVLGLALVHGAIGTAGLLRSSRSGGDGGRVLVGGLYAMTAVLLVGLTATVFSYGLA